MYIYFNIHMCTGIIRQDNKHEEVKRIKIKMYNVTLAEHVTNLKYSNILKYIEKYLNGFHVNWEPLYKHIYIYIYTEWVEIIGQSYESHVNWDTLFIYIYWPSRNNRAITWIPCKLRHPIYIYTYTYTEWAEIIGQSYGPHVYWDYLYTYTKWAEIKGQSYGSHAYWDPIYIHILSEKK